MKKRTRGFLVGILAAVLCVTLSSCGEPDAEYLEEFLSSDADFYALFDSSVGWDVGRYEITSVEIISRHEENKGSMDLTADISCQSEEAIYSGSFAFVLNEYDSGWDVDEMYLLEGAFSMRDQLTAEELEPTLDLDGFLEEEPEFSRAWVSVESIDQEAGEPAARVKFQMSLQTGLLSVTVPAEVDYVYQGAWEAVSGNLAEMSDEELFSCAEFSYAVPSGTYQTMIGRSGFVSSIRIFEEQLDPENPLYCQVISTSAYGDIPEILEEYEGPVYLSDDFQEVLCGDYAFGFDETGQPQFNDTLQGLSYSITYYSGKTTPEEGLNALVSMASSMAGTQSQGLQDAVIRYAYQHSLDTAQIESLDPEALEEQRTQYLVFDPNYYNYDLSGPSADLDPTNPDHVYQEADDWMKSDEELSYREFEQKYHYYYGYCDDFGKVHDAVSDRT